MDLTEHMHALRPRAPGVTRTFGPPAGGRRLLPTLLVLGGSLACIGVSMVGSFRPLRPGLEIAGFAGFMLMGLGDLLAARARRPGRRLIAAAWFLSGVALLVAALARAMAHG
jgi:hypothetical protein